MSSLLKQLEAASGPLVDKKRESEARQVQWKRNVEKAHLQQTANAVERYRAAIKPYGWTTQREIEQRLGYAATVATPFIRKLEELDKVKKRNRDNAPKYQRTRGYEYFWVGG